MDILLSFFGLVRRSGQIFTMLLLCCIHGYAQTRDSKDMNMDTTGFHRQYYVALKETNPDSGIVLLNDLLPKSIAVEYDWATNNILLKLGEYYINKGDCLQALAYMKQAAPYCAALSLIEKSNYFQHIGWVYVELGDYLTASENFYTALDYLKRSGDSRQSNVSICNDLGQVYFRLHQNEKALYYYNQGEDFARKNHIESCATFILYNKGEYYTSIHQLDSARKLYKRVYDIGDKQRRPDVKAMAMEGLGKTYIESKDYNKAISFLQPAIHLSENKYKSVWIETSFYLGEALYNLKKYNQAEAVLGNTLKEATVNKLKDNTLKGYTTLTSVYKATGQYAKALDCMDSIVVLKDSLESSDKAKAINLMDIKFQTAEKDKQIANNQLLIARQNGKIARKNMWMLAVGGCVLLFLFVSIGVYLHTVNRQRSLERENKIAILQAAVHGGDNERGRIARELHDGIGGMLSAAMMRFSTMHHDSAAVTTTPGYTEAMNILREMGDEIRKTAHNLMPDVLLKQSLPEAVRAYCNSVQVDGALKIDFQSYGSFNDLSENYKLNLYRIVQELVKNVIEHSGANHAMVQLLQNENVLIVSVEDNGVGFSKIEVNRGQGLHNTETRVSSLDGTFTIESSPGKGTSVFIEIDIGMSGDKRKLG